MLQGQAALQGEAEQLRLEVQRLQGLLAEQAQELAAARQQQRQQSGPAPLPAGSSHCAPDAVMQRLAAAGEQLRQAQAMGAELRWQLAAKDAALQGAPLDVASRGCKGAHGSAAGLVGCKGTALVS